MGWKILIVILCLWCEVYTVSYGVFEYKNKNTPAYRAVFALCAVLALVAGVTIRGI